MSSCRKQFDQKIYINIIHLLLSLLRHVMSTIVLIKLETLNKIFEQIQFFFFIFTKYLDKVDCIIS